MQPSSKSAPVHQSKEFYQALFQSANNGIFVMEEDRFVECNPAVLEMFQVTEKEILGRTPFEFSPEFQPDGKKSQEAALDKINDVLKGNPQHFEWLHQKSDHALFYTEVSLNTFNYKKKNYILAVVRDITEKKEAEHALKTSQKTLESIFSATPIGIGLLYDRIFDTVNKSLCNMVGYSSEELIGEKARMLYINNEDYRYVGKIMYEERRKSIETRWKHKNGNLIDVLLSATPIDATDFSAGVIFTILDITDRKKAESMLLESEKKYRSLIETTDTGYTILNEKGEVLDANEEYIRMTGHKSLEEIRGRCILDWTADYDRKRNMEEVTKCMRIGYVRNLRMDYKGPSNQIIPIELNATVLESKQGKQVVTICHDVTDQKNREDELINRLDRIQKQEKSIINVITHPSIVEGNIGSASRLIVKEIANTIHAERVSIHFLDDKYIELDQQRCFMCSPKHRGQCDEIDLKKYPKYLKLLKKERAVDAHDIDQDPRVSELVKSYFNPNYICSFLGAPVRIGSELIGALFIEQVHNKRIWQPDEITYAAEMADQITQTILNKQKYDTEQALKESEGRYRNILESSPDAIGVIDLEGDFIECNKALEELHGYTREELLKMKGFDLIAPEYHETAWAHFKDSIQGKDVTKLSIEMVKKSKEKFYCDMSTSILHDAQGNPIAMIAISKDISERLESDRIIHESELKFRSIFDSVPIGMFIYHLEDDNRLVFKDYNPVAEIILDVSCSQFINKTIEQAFPALEKTEIPDAYRNVARTGELFHREDIFYSENNIVGLYDVYAFQNAPDQIVVAFSDITEKRQAIEALRVSEERYRQVVNNATEAIFIVQDMKLVFVNSMMSDIFGYTSEELLLKTGPELIHEEDLPLIIERYQQRLKGEPAIANYSIRIINSANEFRWAELNAVGIDWDGRPAILVFLNDITDRHLAELKLQASEKRYRDLFVNLRDGVCIIDLDSKFQDANPAFLEMLGYSLDELHQYTLYDITPKMWIDIENEQIENTIQQGYTDLYEKEYNHKNGSIIPVESRSYMVYDQEGQGIAIVKVARDITERKKAQELMVMAERSERLASLGTLAAGIAHEINQPLTALKVKVDGLLYWGTEKPEILQKNLIENLRFVSGEAEKISEIIKHMRSLARQEKQGDPDHVYINKIITRGISIIQRKLMSMRIEINLQLVESNPVILAHANPIERVVINLVMNAANALSKTQKRYKQITIKTLVEDCVSLLQVIDNGPGISEEYIPHVFDPFFTTSEGGEGMGLGLSIIQNIVSSYGGTISVTNGKKSGAIFTVKLPLADTKKG